MKTNVLLVLGLAVSLLAPSGRAQQPPASVPAPVSPQLVEIESRFFTIGVDAAERLGLTGDREGSGPSLRSRLSKAAFEKLLGQLSAEKSMKLLSTPRVTTRSNQRAVIEIIREFRYPSEFEIAASDQIVTPTKFETQVVGPTLEVEPFIREGGLIELTAIPKLQAFLRFVAYAGGKTTDPEPIPRDGFQQPVFDFMWSTVGATLRSGQTLLIGGYEWHGRDAILHDELLPPLGAKLAPEPVERQLLFCTLTAKLVEEQDAREYPVAEIGGPVSIMPKLVSVSREQLLQWIGPGKTVSAGGKGTSGEIVDADHAGALRQALGGASEQAFAAAVSGQPGSALVSVIAPAKGDAFLKAVEAVSGSPALFGGFRSITPQEQYFAQARGILRYLPPAPGNGTPGQANLNAGQLEQVDLQLAVKAHCGTKGAIDVDVISTFATVAQPSGGWETFRRTGVVRGAWVLLDQSPRWTKPAVTTSVTVWSGSTVVFVRASEGSPDHLQILLITVRGTPSRAGATPVSAPAAEKAIPPKLPIAIPVPGKPGFVRSPYNPKGGIIDVRGLPPGLESWCSYGRQYYILP